MSAALLRSKVCEDARLSKSAAKLLRRECDIFATRLLNRAVASTSGPVDAQDLWEQLLMDESYSWLIDRLGLCRTNPHADTQGLITHSQLPPPLPLPPGIPLPLPPPGLTADSDLLPRLLWRRAVQPAGAAPPMPLHSALLEQSEGAAAEGSASHREPSPLHPSLVLPSFS